ncbi:4-hydroxy-tetrahydrodipicolinate reductase [Bengtsoniella intestinalis]|uniref:4-hydroxy-tetrahydrodipicolinate reductase n=1 Tax=Bengtsoniella intestinalis TaxID=3073143 RepID=UPI00391F769E
MRVVIIGKGRMGTLIAQTLEQAGDTVAATIDIDNFGDLATLEGADVVIDFSAPASLDAVCEYVRRTKTPIVSGTTGYTPEQKEQLASLGDDVAVLWSANYSLGVAVCARVLGQMTEILRPSFDIEVTETHHNQKVDAPSGTAKLWLEHINPRGEMTPVYGREGICGKRNPNEIGMHALRGGTVAGTHTVQFFGDDEEIALTHRATSRQIFVNGAVHMAGLVATKEAGCYDIQKILFGV